jgi:putative hemolysin
MKKTLLLLLVLGIIFLVIFSTAKKATAPQQNINKQNQNTTNEQQDLNSNQSANSNNSLSLANPASVNCLDQGGRSVMQEGPLGQYGLCYFEDNRACEEWAMFRGDCPVGGMKTTGYDTEAQKYCAWVGGATFAIPNAICTFKDGSTCPVDALYSGQCQKGQNK